MTLREQQDYFMDYLKEALEDTVSIRERVTKAFTNWFQALVEVPEVPAVSTKQSGKDGGGGGGGEEGAPQ